MKRHLTKGHQSAEVISKKKLLQKRAKKRHKRIVSDKIIVYAPKIDKAVIDQLFAFIPKKFTGLSEARKRAKIQ